MDILGVGPLELLVILVFILIFVGPERLPQAARQIGKVYRQLHEMSRTVAAQWQEELSAAAELEGDKKDLRKALSEPLQAAKADAERILTASLTASSSEQPGNTKPPAGGSVVSVPAVVTAPDGRTADALPTSVAPPGVPQEQKAQEEKENTPLPDAVTPDVEAPDASASTSPEDVADAAPPATPPLDGDPEYGDR